MRRMEETVTWTDKAGKSGSLRAASTERMALGPDFDAATPRKFIRMHLPGHAGDEVYGARALNRQGDTYTLDMLYVKPRQWTPESATIFPVVFEPFGGSPFIKSVRLLTPEASLKHASSSVAIEVVTFGGRRDVICMAGRQSPAATLEGMTFHGEYAMVSFDEKGLRQAALAAGTKLDVKDLTITTDRPAYEGTVKSIDYDARTAELSAPLPKEAANAVIEVGSTGRPTTYTLTSAEGTRVAFDKGMDLYMSHVVEFNAEGLPVLQMAGTLTGGLTATDDNCKTWWKLAADPGTPSEGVRLEQGPAAQGALTTGDALRVWEIGPGDAYRLPVVINIVRQAGGEFRTVANAPVTVRPAESGKGTHTNPTR
jgi:hypothetical protein